MFNFVLFINPKKQNAMKKLVCLLGLLLLVGTAAQAQDAENVAPAAQTKSVSKCDDFKVYIAKIKWQGYCQMGLLFGDAVGPTLEGSFGARIYDYLYVGAEIAYKPLFDVYYYYEEDEPALLHDAFIGANVKCYVPAAEKIYPFMNLSLGYHNFNKVSTFGLQFGTGLDFGHFSFGIGYDMVHNVDNFGYIKFGVVF